MIWQVSFSQKTTLWILAAGVLIGSGVLLVQKLSHDEAQFAGVATAQFEKEAEFKRRADSIMHSRIANAEAPINVNTATAAQLETLKGIGPVLASNIIEYREQNGPFTSIEDLLNVSGIGPKRLEALRARCVIDSF